MDAAVQPSRSEERNAVALKAYRQIVEQWGLTLAEAAALADMSESTWKRARKPLYVAELTHDQLLRLSAIIGIYKALALYFSEALALRWVTMPNQGPLFGGARPLDTMIEDGLPQFLRVRAYLDALRGGA